MKPYNKNLKQAAGDLRNNMTDLPLPNPLLRGEGTFTIELT